MGIQEFSRRYRIIYLALPLTVGRGETQKMNSRKRNIKFYQSNNNVGINEEIEYRDVTCNETENKLREGEEKFTFALAAVQLTPMYARWARFDFIISLALLHY